MCMIDDVEGHVTEINVTTPRARREHYCAECGRVIGAGERYERNVHVWDGAMICHKTCEHCLVARQWLQDECGGWLFGAVEEDIREHAHSGDYPMGVHRLAVGMAWKWRTPTGKLLPVPKVPQTTHERIHAV